MKIGRSYKQINGKMMKEGNSSGKAMKSMNRKKGRRHRAYLLAVMAIIIAMAAGTLAAYADDYTDDITTRDGTTYNVGTVHQSTSQTSKVTFGSGMPLSTVYIDTNKMLYSSATYTKLANANDPEQAGFAAGISDALLDSGGLMIAMYDPSAATQKLLKGQDNYLAGELFSLTFSDAAELPDGSRASVKVTFSNAHIFIDERVVDDNNGDPIPFPGAVYLAAVSKSNTNDSGAFFYYGNTNTNDYDTDSGQLDKRSATGSSMDMRVQIVDDQGSPVEGTFILPMVGINLARGPQDVSTSGARPKVSKPLDYLYNDFREYYYFNEGMRINGGNISDIFVRPDVLTGESGSNNEKGYFPAVTKQTAGAYQGAVKFTSRVRNGVQGSDTQYCSGFITTADAKAGINLTGYGHGVRGGQMTTRVLSNQTPMIWHRITSVTTPGGNIQTTTEGNTSKYGKLDDEGTILDPGKYVVPDGKTVVYTMTPDKGYELQSVKLKGTDGNYYNVDISGLKKAGDKVENITLNGTGGTGTLIKNRDGSYTFEFPENNADQQIHVAWVPVRVQVIAKKYWDDYSNAFKARKETTFHLNASSESGQTSTTFRDFLPEQTIAEDNTSTQSYGGSVIWGDESASWTKDSEKVYKKVYADPSVSSDASDHDILEVDHPTDSNGNQLFWFYDQDTQKFAGYIYDDKTHKYKKTDEAYYVDYLSKYDKDGSAINYTVTEDSVEDYTTTISKPKDTDTGTDVYNRSYDVTNSIDMEVMATATIKAEKTIEGRQFLDTDRFKFILAGEDGSPMPVDLSDYDISKPGLDDRTPAEVVKEIDPTDEETKLKDSRAQVTFGPIAYTLDDLKETTVTYGDPSLAQEDKGIKKATNAQKGIVKTWNDKANDVVYVDAIPGTAVRSLTLRYGDADTTPTQKKTLSWSKNNGAYIYTKEPPADAYITVDGEKVTYGEASHKQQSENDIWTSADGTITYDLSGNVDDGAVADTTIQWKDASDNQKNAGHPDSAQDSEWKSADGSLTYTTDTDIPATAEGTIYDNTFKYHISENPQHPAAVENDTAVRDIEVYAIFDPENKKILISSKKDGDTYVTGTDATVDRPKDTDPESMLDLIDVFFNNVYGSKGTYTPIATKILEGRALTKDKFTFSLKAVDTPEMNSSYEPVGDGYGHDLIDVKASDTPMPEGTDKGATAKNKSMEVEKIGFLSLREKGTDRLAGNITFNDITYTTDDLKKTIMYKARPSEEQAADGIRQARDDAERDKVTEWSWTDDGKDYVFGSIPDDAEATVEVDGIEDTVKYKDATDAQRRAAEGDTADTKWEKGGKHYIAYTTYNDPDRKDNTNIIPDDAIGTYYLTERAFTYEMKEVVPETAEPGYTYDDTTYVVRVRVTDNGDGTVSATGYRVDTKQNGTTTVTEEEIDTDDGDVLLFTNKYEPQGQTQVEAQKEWDDYNNGLSTREDVTLHLDASYEKNGETITVSDIRPPKTIKADATGADLTVTWGTEKYYRANKYGDYFGSGNTEVTALPDISSITQENGYSADADNISIDTTEKGVFYKYEDKEGNVVKKDGIKEIYLYDSIFEKTKDGEKITYSVREDEIAGYSTKITQADRDDGDPWSFTVTNKTIAGTVNVYATKSMEGRSFADGDKFTFMISGKDGAPMPVKYNEQNKAFEADDVTKDATIKPGTVKASVDLGMIAYTVNDLEKKKVTYGTAKAAQKKAVTQDWYKEENGPADDPYERIVYVSEIPGDAVAAFGSGDSDVVKYKDATNDEKASANEESETESLWRSKDGKIKYTTADVPDDAVSYVYQNVFTYEIMENPKSVGDKDDPSVENDKSVKEIKVYVLWDPSEGKIYASAKKKDGAFATENSDITVDAYSGDMRGRIDLEDVYFTNKYTSDGTWTPEALKVLSGRPLERDQFSFKIEAVDTMNGNDVVVRKEDTPMPEGTSDFKSASKQQDVKAAGENEEKGANSVNGPVSFDKIEYTQDDLKQFVIYDKDLSALDAAQQTAYKTNYPGIRKEKADSNEKNQSVTWEWTENGKTYVYGLIPDDAKATVTVNGKEFTDVSYADATDSQRKAGEGTTKDTKWVKGGKYYIGLEYDDDGDISNANLIADYAVGTIYLQQRTFTYQIYEDVPDDARATIDGTEYTYADALAEAAKTTDPAITKADIEAVKWTKDGFKYDASSRTVSVKVTDDGKGRITAVPEFNPDEAFKNEYEAAGDVKMLVTKDIEGKQFDGENEFTFTLLAKNGAPLPTAYTNDDYEVIVNPATGTATVKIKPESGSSYDFDFGDISFTHEDLMSGNDYDAVRTKDGYYQKTFMYEIVETAATGDGVNKDPKRITVAVTVQEDKKGNITVVAVNSDDSDNMKAADLQALKAKEMGFFVDQSTAYTDSTAAPPSVKPAHSYVKAGVFTNGYDAEGFTQIKATKELKTASTDDTKLAENQFYFELLGKKFIKVDSPKTSELASYYEKDGAKYKKTADTEADPGKTYYKLDFGVLDTKPNASPASGSTDNKGLITFDALVYDLDSVKIDAENGIAAATPASNPDTWTYTYKVKEIVPHESGRASTITYDTSEKTVIVVVKDNGNGTLEVKKYLDSVSADNEIPDTNEGNEEILFTNEIKTVNIPVQKIWDGAPVENVTLRLERALIDPYENGGETLKDEATIKAEAEALPNSSWKTDGRRITVEMDEFNKETGGAAIYSDAPSGQGGAAYKGYIDGFNKNVPLYVVKDGKFWRAVYRITEDNTSSEYVCTYKNGNTEQRIYATDASATPLTVKNTTVASGVGEVAAVKQLVGREWNNKDDYEFILEPLGKAEYEIVTDPDTQVKSNVIKLDSNGNVVYVKDGGGNVDKAIPMPSASNDPDAAQVIYSRTPAEESAKIGSQVVGEGERLADFKNIQFKVKDLTYDEIDGHMQGDFYYTMKEKIPDSAVLYNSATGKPVTDDQGNNITYGSVKNSYTIAQFKGTNWKVTDESSSAFDGVVYDGTVHTVRIKVRGTRNENFMVQTIYDQTDQAADKTGTLFTPVYTNHYESKGSIEGVFLKEIVGRDPGSGGDYWVASDEFEFKVKAFNGDDAPMPTDNRGNVVTETTVTKASDKVGEGASANLKLRRGSFGTIHFDESHLYDVYKTGNKAGTRYGIYYYTFYESDIDQGSDLAKDDTQYFVKVTVEDVGSGKLSTKAEYYKSADDLVNDRPAGEISENNMITFENVKTRELYVKKTWNGPVVRDAEVHLEKSTDDGATWTPVNVTYEKLIGSGSSAVWSEITDNKDVFQMSEFKNGTAQSGKRSVVHRYRGLPTYEFVPKQGGGTEEKKIKYRLAEDSPVAGNGFTVTDTDSYQHDVDGQDNGKDGSSEGNALTIENKYDAHAEQKVNVVKVISGRDWEDDDAFNYTLKGVKKATSYDASGDPVIENSSNNPMPGTAGAGNTATTAATGTGNENAHPAEKGSAKILEDGRLAEFAKIKFTQSDLIMNEVKGRLQGDFFYEIEEVIPAGAKATINGQEVTYGSATDAQKAAAKDQWVYNGVTYKEATHTVHIRVLDEMDGTLHAEIAYNESTPGDTSTGQGFTPVYVNVYNTKGVAKIPATKHLSKRNWKDGDSFTFTLQPLAGAPMPMKASGNTPESELKVTAAFSDAQSAGALDQDVTKFFADIPLKEEGEFIYRIQEDDHGKIITKADGTKLEYAEDPVYVKVTVTDDKKGNLVASDISYYTDSACTNKITGATSAVFTNKVLRDIKITKEWKGEAVSDVTITLQRKVGEGDWENVDEYFVSRDEFSDTVKTRSRTFEDLPAFDENGNAIAYRVVEPSGTGYISNATAGSGGVAVPAHTEGDTKEAKVVNRNMTTTSIQGTKDWIDGEDRTHADTGKDIGEKLELHATVATSAGTTNYLVTKDIDNEDIEWNWSGDGNTKYTVSNLPKYDADGNLITYWVVETTDTNGDVGEITINKDESNEENVTYGAPSYDNSGSTVKDKAYNGGKITNKIKQEKINFYGQKVWDHGDNTTYPSAVMMRLYQKKKGDSQATAVAGKSLQINGSAHTETGGTETAPEDEDPDPQLHYNKWNFQFEGLDRYDEDGNEIKYSIHEDHVTGYKLTDTSGSGEDAEHRYALTNKFGSKSLDVINVKKTVDNNVQWRTDTGSFEVADPAVDADIDKYYERSGAGTTESPYVYTKTSDTQVDSGKTYYVATWPKVGEDPNKEDAKFVINLINMGNDQDITQPMPKTDPDKGVTTSHDGTYSRIVVDSEAKYDTALPFGEIEFDKPGVYKYAIRELTAAEANVTRIAGMTYDDEVYTLVVTVTEDDQGELHIDTVVKDKKGDEVSKTGDEYILPIKNVYSQDEAMYHMEAQKDYYDRTKTHSDGTADVVISDVDKKFQFTMRPVKIENDDADPADSPMPSNVIYDKKTGIGLQGNGKDRVYYTRNNTRIVEFEHGLIFYRNRPDGGGTDIGKNYSYELAEVIPDDAVYIGDGFWFNESDQTVYDGVVHIRRLKVGERNGAIVVTLDYDTRRDKMLPANTGQTYKAAYDAAAQAAAADSVDIYEKYIAAPPADNKYTRHKGNIPMFLNYKDPLTDIQAEKDWDDDNNRDGGRPEYTYFTIRRYKTDSTTEFADVVDIEGNNLTTKKDASGAALPEGFTTATVKINGTKADEALKAVWKDLPQYERIDDDATGENWRPTYKKIRYVVEETDEYGNKLNYSDPFGSATSQKSVEKYTATVSAPDDQDKDNGRIDTDYTITNKHEPEKADVVVTKEWNDRSDVDGVRPDELDIYLDRQVKDDKSSGAADTDTRTETKTIEDKTLTSADKAGSDPNNWTHTWKNVYKYVDGKEITYIVREDIPDGYTANSKGKVTAVYNSAANRYEVKLTNTHAPDTIDIEATKVWDDDNDRDGNRQNVKFRLLADGERAKNISGTDTDDKTVAKDAAESARTVKWTDLPVNTWKKADPAVNPADEGFYEKDGSNYVPTTDTSVDGEKNYYKQTAIDYSTVEVDKDENNNEVLLDGSSGKNKTSYGYTVSVTGSKTSGFTVTNAYTPEQAYIRVIKDWNDNDNQDGARTSANISMKVHIYKTVGSGSSEKTTYVGSEMVKSVNVNQESYVDFGPLPIYENGQRIKYTIEEESSGVYMTKYVLGKKDSRDGNGDYIEDDYNDKAEVNVAGSTELSKDNDAEHPYIVGLRNTKAKDTTKVDVEKVWLDDDNADGKRPAKICVDLYKTTKTNPEPIPDEAYGHTEHPQEGETAGDWTFVRYAEIEPDSNGKWKYEFENLDKNELVEGSSKPVRYYVVEEKVQNGYTQVSETGDQSNGYTITNTRERDELEIELTKSWDDKNDVDGIRPSLKAFSGNIELWRSTNQDGSGAVNVTKQYASDLTLSLRGNDHVFTWENLPRNKDKANVSDEVVPYYYFVREAETPKGYEAYNTADLGTGDDKYTGKTPLTGTTNVAVTLNNDETEGTASITNRHEAETVDVKSRKIWADNILVNGSMKKAADRPDTVKLTLQRRVAKVQDPSSSNNDDWTSWEDYLTHKLSKDKSTAIDVPGGDFAAVDNADTWVYTFRDLPKTEADQSGNNRVVEYRVVENNADVPAGYVKSYSRDDTSNVIINTYQVTSIEGTKVWTGGPDQHDTSEEVKLKVYWKTDYAPSDDEEVVLGKTYYSKDGDTYTEVTPQGEDNPKENGWYVKDEKSGTVSDAHIDWNNKEYTVNGLPKYNKYGVRYTYWVVEYPAPEGYEPSYSNNNNSNLDTSTDAAAKTDSQKAEKDKAYNGGVITNTFNGKTKLSGTKVWDGGSSDKHVNANGDADGNGVADDKLGIKLYRGYAADGSDGTEITTVRVSGEERPLVVRWSRQTGGDAQSKAVYQFGYVENGTFKEYEFDMFDKDSSRPYVYTVKETNAPDGYTASIDGFDITNTYKADPAKITPVITKKVSGMPDEVNDTVKKFRFVLAAKDTNNKAMPAPVRTSEETVALKKGKSEAQFDFGELKFTYEDLKKDDGTYAKSREFSYDLYEKAEDGWSMQPSRTITIVVTDNEEGGLTAKVKGAVQWTAVIPKSGDDPKAKGWYEYDEYSRQYIKTEDTTVSDDKTYYAPEYSVVKDPVVNTYDKSAKTFVPDITVTKSLEGDTRTLGKDEFKFTLTGQAASGAYKNASGKTAVGTNSTDADSDNNFETVEFSGVTFDKTDELGKYLFIMKETKESLPGIIYDEKEYKVEVNVTDKDADGDIEAEWKITEERLSAEDEWINIETEEGAAAEFINDYDKQPVDVIPSAKKTLTVPEGSERVIENEEFDFRLVGLDGAGNEVVRTGKNEDPDADGDNNALTAGVKWDNENKLTFTIDDLKNEDGTFDTSRKFKFVAYEKAGNAKGMSYDGNIYTGTLRLYIASSGADEGQLKYEWTWKNSDGTQVTYDADHPLGFTNEYDPDAASSSLTAETGGNIPVYKELTDPNGKRELAADEFVFLLEGQPAVTGTKDASGMKALAVNAAPGSDGKGKVEFPAFQFTETGKYVFVLKEVKGNDPTIDEWDRNKYQAVAEVTEDKTSGKTNGGLKVSWSVKKLDGDDQPEGEALRSVTFTNKVGPETVSVPVEKVWKGDTKLGVATSEVRPDSVKARVYIDANNKGRYDDGEEVYIKDGAVVAKGTDGAVRVADKTLQESGSDPDGSKWTATFKNLPRYKSDGTAVVYSVTELDAGTGKLSGYTAAYTQPAENDGIAVITNTMITTRINGHKEWHDNGRDHNNASELKLHVWYQPMNQSGAPSGDPKEISTSEITWSGDKNRTYTVTGLPKCDSYGNEYTYWVEEEQVKGYAPPAYTNTGDNSNVTDKAYNGGSIINTASEVTSVPFTKRWIADTELADQESKVRPYSIDVRLYIDANNNGRFDDGEEVYIKDGALSKKGVSGAVEVEVITVDKSGSWAGVFASLPKYTNDGAAIEYKLAEVAYKKKSDSQSTNGIPKHYTATYEQPQPAAPGIIINTYSQPDDNVKVTATKVWQGDEDVMQSKRKEVKFQLYQEINGAKKKLGTELVAKNASALPGQPAGSAEWTVPKYYGEDLIKYTVEEITSYNDLEKDYDTEAGDVTAVDAEGNTVADPDEDPDDVAGYKVTITNTLKGSTKSVSVIKKWDDNNDQDGIRPASITVTVRNNKTNESAGTIELKNSKNYAGSLDKLPAFDDKGSPIHYTVTEDNVPAGYTVSYGGNENTGFTVTNKRTPDTISVTATKKWTGDDSVKNDTRKKVKLHLIGNGKDSGIAYDAGEKTIDADFDAGSGESAGKATWNNLPKKLNGETLEWTVYEQVVPGYVVSGGDKPKEVREGSKLTGYKFDITNKYAGSVSTVKATKIWDDEGNVDQKRKSVYFQLYRKVGTDGKEEKVGDPVKRAVGPNFESDLEWTWRDLPETLTGEDTYEKVKTASGSGQGDEDPGDDPNAMGLYELDGDEYKLTEDTTVVKGKKYYEKTGEETYEEVTLNPGSSQSADDSDVNPYENGWYEKDGDEYVPTDDTSVDKDKDYYERKESTTEKAVIYWVKEVVKEGNDWKEGAPQGYESVTAQTEPGVFEVNNIHEPELIDIKVNKIWNDDDDKDKIRPDHIEIKLMDGSDVIAKAVVTEGEGDDKWTWTFKDVPKNKNGEPVSYKIEEKDIEGYTMSGGDEPSTTGEKVAYTITNTHNSSAMYDVIAIKNWSGDDKDRAARKDVTFHLVKVVGDEKTEIKDAKTIKANATGDDLKVKWENLPVYEGGKHISYTIREDHIDKYTTSVSDTKVTKEPVFDEDSGRAVNGEFEITVTNKYSGIVPRDDDGKVKITYVDPKAKSGSMILKTSLHDTQSAADTAAKKKTGKPKDPSHKGSKFIGWDVNQDEYGDYILVAKYSDPVTSDKIVVSYVDGQSKKGVVKSVITGKPGSVKAPASPKHKGAIFVGWKKTKDAAGNIIYVAKYKCADKKIKKAGKNAPASGSFGPSGKHFGPPDKDNPGGTAKTGDSFNLTMWIAIMAGALALLLIAAFARRKKN